MTEKVIRVAAYLVVCGVAKHYISTKVFDKAEKSLAAKADEEARKIKERN